MAVKSITGGHIVAVSDIDSGPCKLLEVRRPGVPNLGDITTLDWTPGGLTDAADLRQRLVGEPKAEQLSLF